MATKPWNPSRRTRIAIGLATLWQWLYVALFLAFIGAMVLLGSMHRALPRGFKAVFAVLFVLHCAWIVLPFVLIAVYVLHAATNEQLTQEQRTAWILVLLFTSTLAFPFYWWMYLKPGVRTED